jgi:hypothetical protein
MISLTDLSLRFMSSEDGLVNPTVLDYDKATNRLLVVNESESGFCFKLQGENRGIVKH